MSNLNTAILSIEAEIKHANDGMAYYISRVEALEKTLSGLIAIDGESLPASSPAVSKKEAQSAPRANAPTKNKKQKAVKASSKTKIEGELPSTGGDYWPNLLSDQPKHAAEIFQSALDQMGFKPTADQKQKLKQRMTFALNALVKAGSVKDQGKGRERQFFKG